ncbi:hypothetical protein [Mycobacterium intracellulare]|nr:hypothetical protein [Mycobacterium intracellulare]
MLHRCQQFLPALPHARLDRADPLQVSGAGRARQARLALIVNSTKG